MTRKTLCLCAVLVGALVAGSWWYRSHDEQDRIGHPKNSLAVIEPSGLGIRFRDVRQEADVDFHHMNYRRDSLLPEDTGSGLGWCDFDNDGDDDLYLVNFAGPFLMDEAELQERMGNRLYRNEGDGKFVDVTDQSGTGHVGWDYGCLWFDYDNDGWNDLAVTHYRGIVLYHNQKDGTFTDATNNAGLGDVKRFLQGMTAGDYDSDGDLDLYLCGYVVFDRERARNRPQVAGRAAVWTNPVSYAALPNILLQNQGNGTFINVTEEAGVENAKGKSMQALFCDFDNDGWPDLYVGNDVGTPDALFHNQQDGTFENVAVLAGTFDRRASMGLAVGDVWNRGVMDFFTTHWVAEDHALWKNMSVPADENNLATLVFEDVGLFTGIVNAKAPSLVGWGTGLQDFDNDGDLDMMIANGSTIEDELTLDVLSNPKLIPQTSQVLENGGDAQYIDVSEKAGSFFQRHLLGRGLAFADFDQDGRMDAAMICHGDQVALLKNVSEPARHWLQVRLSGKKNNAFGIGALIIVTTSDRTQSRQCVLSSSYLSTNSRINHFGVGDVTTIDQVRVVWPDGTEVVRNDVLADQVIVIDDQ